MIEIVFQITIFKFIRAAIALSIFLMFNICSTIKFKGVYWTLNIALEYL